MNINLTDYISEDEMKRIATEEFRNQIRKQSRQSLERVINNAAYAVVWEAVDECMDGEAISFLKSKVLDIINDMTSFNVFATPNAWDRKENMAHNLLVKAVRDNHSLLEQKVVVQMDTLSKTQIAKIASEIMKEKLSKVI